MWKILLLPLLTSLFVGTSQGKKLDNDTSGINPRFFRGQTISVQLPLPSNLTDMITFGVSDTELMLLSNNTVWYLRCSLSTHVIPAIYVVAIIIGIPANVAILVKVAKMHMVSLAILCCSLAVSDLLLLLSLLFKAHYHFSGNDWAFGEAMCRITTACFYGNLYCSAHTLACVSIKRYLAVVHPFFYRSLPKRSCTACAGTAVWVVFSLAMLPELLVQQNYHITQLGIKTCHDVLPVDHKVYDFLVYYNIGLTLLGFLLPLLVSAVCYVSIVWHLNRSHHDWSVYIKASTVVFFIFVICFGPSSCIHFLHYIRLYSSREEHFYVYSNLATCLCCLHCCLDPFLLILLSRTTGSKLYFITQKENHEKSVSISN